MRSDVFDIRYLDTLSRADSPLHRLDPRAKVITTVIFILTVVSFPRYALSALIPFFIFPVVLIAVSGLPAGYLMKKVLMVLPLAAVIAVFNPVIDRQTLFYIGPLAVSGGWVSFLSIVIRFFLTVTAAFVLIASCGFDAVCLALSKLGLPKPFVVQLMFLYRYIFVLAEESERMVSAAALRSASSRNMKLGVFVPLSGHLLLRTLDRSQRIYLAMCSRGFDGRLRLIHTMKRGRREVIFTAGWFLSFMLLRFSNIPLYLGTLLTHGF